MSFFKLLYTVLIKPLQLVFEIVFMIANRLLGHPGLAIIALSLAMNLLVLPLYRRADAMQEEARDMDRKLRRGVSHIKKTFSGDERMMILQTYYRQNHYAPTDSLKGSVSLLLEIPFFIAAYQFLSHLLELQGVAFGPIADLGAPDALIAIGNLSINLLPFLMTGINLISSALFLRGFPLKSKIQLYGMALFFLVFLYNSPSGLVFYWTLNNLFSLVKTIFYKIPNPRKVLRLLASAVGIAVALAAACLFGLSRPKLLAAGLLLGLCLQLPVLHGIMPGKEARRILKSDRKLFTCCSCFLVLLTGILIPSSVIAAAPVEFTVPFYYHNPLLYVLAAALLAAGSFLVWLRIFYSLAGEKAQPVFEIFLFALSLCMPVNYLFFGTDFGQLSSNLVYTEVYTLLYSPSQQILNLLLMALIFAAAWLLVRRKPNWARSLMLTLCLTAAVLSAVNLFGIASAVSGYKSEVADENAEQPEIALSKDGKNVIVLMIDRAYGSYLPYFLEEKPELARMYDGFTYYPNTLSFGVYTNYGVPPVFGGYEYTPAEMNKRSDEMLVDKHNEACRLMPSLFYEEGYEVTVADVSYANYSFESDLSIYDEYEGMKKYNLKGRFLDAGRYESMLKTNYRNFFCFSLVKCIPPSFQNLLYFQGNYCQAMHAYSPQVCSEDLLTASGASYNYDINSGVLDLLPELSAAAEKENTFLLLCNETAHDGTLLQMPDYVSAPHVDNRSFDYRNDFYDYAVESGDSYALTFYHSCMSSLLRLGEWFDYLRENGCYDNSRIIVVADHGRGNPVPAGLSADSMGTAINIGAYNPLLLVKDFNGHGFTVSNEFMTNADTPALALEGLIENPVNPFTGKAINADAKNSETLYLTPLDFFNPESEGNATQYRPSVWFSVSDNIFDHSNWKYYGDEPSLLPPQ